MLTRILALLPLVFFFQSSNILNCMFINKISIIQLKLEVLSRMSHRWRALCMSAVHQYKQYAWLLFASMQTVLMTHCIKQDAIKDKWENSNFKFESLFKLNLKSTTMDKWEIISSHFSLIYNWSHRSAVLLFCNYYTIVPLFSNFSSTNYFY